MRSTHRLLKEKRKEEERTIRKERVFEDTRARGTRTTYEVLVSTCRWILQQFVIFQGERHSLSIINHSRNRVSQCVIHKKTKFLRFISKIVSRFFGPWSFACSCPLAPFCRFRLFRNDQRKYLVRGNLNVRDRGFHENCSRSLACSPWTTGHRENNLAPVRRKEST